MSLCQIHGGQDNCDQEGAFSQILLSMFAGKKTFFFSHAG